MVLKALKRVDYYVTVYRKNKNGHGKIAVRVMVTRRVPVEGLEEGQLTLA